MLRADGQVEGGLYAHCAAMLAQERGGFPCPPRPQLSKEPAMPLLLLLFLLLLTITSAIASDNPPAQGFNATDSDPQAIALADAAMAAMGGRANWDATRYIT